MNVVVPGWITGVGPWGGFCRRSNGGSMGSVKSGSSCRRIQERMTGGCEIQSGRPHSEGAALRTCE